MKAIEYHLNIYAPGSRSEVLVGWQSSTAFLPFSRGDIISCKGFEPSRSGRGRMLLVEGIEHIIWEAAGSITHKICVITKLA